MTFPVVVGVDGSDAALEAALWAVDEAVTRGVPVRLIHAVDPSVAGRDTDEKAHGHDILCKARQAIIATRSPVEIDTDIENGDPADVLVEASRGAPLVCVGWRGMRDTGDMRQGSIARRVVREAASPVAVVRRRHPMDPLPPGRWVVAVLDESTNADAVLDTALEEALQRSAPLLALTSWSTTVSTRSGGDGGVRERVALLLDTARHDPLALQVSPIPAPNHMLNFLRQSHTIDQLVVVHDESSAAIADLLGPDATALMEDSNCSVLVVRRYAARR